MRAVSGRGAASALLLAMMCGLAMLSAAPAGAVVRSDEMTENQAGRYYLKVVCKYNAARDRYNEVLFPETSSN